MMSYAFSELLEWADNVSCTYSLVTHKKSWVKAWEYGKKLYVCTRARACMHTERQWGWQH